MDIGPALAAAASNATGYLADALPIVSAVFIAWLGVRYVRRVIAGMMGAGSFDSGGGLWVYDDEEGFEDEFGRSEGPLAGPAMAGWDESGTIWYNGEGESFALGADWDHETSAEKKARLGIE